MFRLRTTPARGSSLVLAMILLAVLAVIGVAAVRLGSVERVNASAKGKRDFLVACAHAARLTLWTAITREGTGYLESTTTPPMTITLPDGTELTAPAAPTGSSKDGLPVADLVSFVQIHSAEATAQRDITNAMVGSRIPANSGYLVLTRCRDTKGRELLVELSLKFAF